MPTTLLPIVGPAYDSGILSQNQQRLINWYIEVDQFVGLHKSILRPTPGMKSFSTVGSESNIRGLLDYRGVLYCVAEHTLYSIDSAGTETSLGSLDTGASVVAEPVRMVASGGNIMIIDNKKAYVYNITNNTVQKVNDPDFPSSVDDCTVHDTYFVVVATDSEKFYISAVTDPTDWLSLDTASSNLQGDYLRACVSDHRELWLFGDKSIEVWINTQNPDFPFERRAGVSMSKGIASIRSLVSMDNSLFWLAKDEAGQNLVIRAEGYTLKNLANNAVAHKINSYDTVSDAIAYSHRIGTHQFYVLTFPTEEVTWVYDVSNNQWHERQSYLVGTYTRHLGNVHAHAYGKSLVGDYQSNAVYEYDEDTYDEGGARLLRRRVSPPMYANNNYVSLYDFQLDFEPGVGLQLGQGKDPQVMLKISTDGGHTFGNEIWKSLGTVGSYSHRVVWDNLGIGRDWVFDIQITDPINAVLLGATADIELNE